MIPQARLWTHVRLAAELRRQPPDIFFTPAHVIPATYRGASVATVHDLGYQAFPEAHTRRQLAYLRWSTAHNARRGRRVITDSEATKADLVRHHGIAPEKIDVVYPGLDPALRPVSDEIELGRIRDKYGITGPYLLAIGTIQPRKNLERLVEAYERSGVTAQLVLAGKVGWRSDSILATVAKHQRSLPVGSERIVLPGFVADEDKAALISGAVALLFPSLYEGFGFPLLEGNVCGTPVLAADSSSLPEIADGAALLVDPLETDAISRGIRRLFDDQDLRRHLIQAGKLNARRFDWNRCAEQVMATLEQAKRQTD